MKAIYLGDGAYFSEDPNNLFVLANHEDPTQASNKFYLGPEAMERLRFVMMVLCKKGVDKIYLDRGALKKFRSTLEEKE